MRVQFSIPAYRSIVHTTTALRLGDFLLCAKEKEWAIHCYMPDSPDVDFAQNLILEKAIREGADVCLMMGADNHAPGADLVQMIEGLFKSPPIILNDKIGEFVTSETLFAAIAAPCKHRGGGINVRAREGEEQITIEHLNEKRVFPAYRIGFGIVAFKCQWYRKNWGKGPWLRSVIATDDAGVLYRESQDYTHCEEVQKRGGIVLADPRVRAGHELDMRKGV